MKILAFSVPVFKYKVQNWNTKKKKLLDLFNSFDNKVSGNVITSPISNKLTALSEEVKLFESEIGLNLTTSEVWFQQYDHTMNHDVHNHGPGGFSSICFIEFDKKYHRPTTFISPFEDFIGEKTSFIPDVEEGDIIFFPSNLLHYAPTNLSKVKRIIVSFNLSINHSRRISYS